MNSIKYLSKALLLFLFISIGFYLLGINIYSNLHANKILIIILSNLTLSLFTIVIVHTVFSIDKTGAARTYFASVFIKIIAFGLLLYPNIVFQKNEIKLLLLFFMSNFFTCLILEITLLIRLLNSTSYESKKNDENQA